MYAEITAAIQSAKTLTELLKSARSLANYNQFVTAIYEVNAKLMDASAVALSSQEKQSLLSERVRELEQQVAQEEDWKSQIQCYQLYQFTTGALAYALKKDMQGNEPMHYLCASCVDKRQISKLQPRGNSTRALKCHTCGLDIQILPLPPAGTAKTGYF